MTTLRGQSSLLQQNSHSMLIEAFAMLIEKILEQNSKICQTKNVFQMKSVPSISIKDYVLRFDQFIKYSNSVIILSLIYMDRYQQRKAAADFFVDSLSIHKFFLGSFVLASKYTDDQFYTNKYYAKVGGVSLNELNSIQKEIVETIQFDLYVESEQFMKYTKKLTKFYKAHKETPYHRQIQNKETEIMPAQITLK